MILTENQELFFQFLGCSLTGRAFDKKLTDGQWAMLFSEAKRQAVVGVLWTAIEALPKDSLPPRELLLVWYSFVERIKNMNRRLNKASVKAARTVEKVGFPAVLLKGQGVGTYYPDSSLRMPGDVDLWLKGKRGEIVEYSRTFQSAGEVRYNHVHLPLFEDVEVEAHFIPSWMNSPRLNRRLQAFFRKEFEAQYCNRIDLGGEGEISVPEPRFNAVFILLHIFRHLLGEGIGLRQIVDYYYVLQRLECNDLEMVGKELTSLHLNDFAAGLMYIMERYLGLPHDKLLFVPDKERGLSLLNEIMRGGNFGQHSDADCSGKISLCGRMVKSLKHNSCFFKLYPEEVAFDPIFKVWQYLWQTTNGYR